MGSRFKRTVISEGVRRSLSGWKRRVKARHATPHTTPLLSSTPIPTPTTTATTTTSSDSVLSGTHRSDDFASTSTEGSSSGVYNTSHGIGMSRQSPFFGSPLCDSFSSNDSEIRHRSVNNNDATSP